jgi:hypothetical protein
MQGLNFGAGPIAPAIAKRFAKRTRPAIVKSRYDWLYLQGVAQSIAERDAMILQADNGRRIIKVVPRKTAAGVWFGIYIG